MDPNEISSIVGNLVISPDLNKLEPLKTSNVWKEQIKALINLIPGVGGAIAQEIQVIENYKTAEFFRKFTKYILGISDTTVEERNRFSKEIEEASHDYYWYILLGMVDRLDNNNKQTILANLTKARISSIISIEDYFRLSSMLERIPYVDFKFLPLYQEPHYDENGDTELLFSTGVLQIAVIDVNDNNKYILSDLGKILVIHGLGKNIEIKRGKGTEVALNTMSKEDIDKLFDNKLDKSALEWKEL